MWTVGLLVSVALAGKNGDTDKVLHSSGLGCEFYTGAVQPSGSMPIMAECVWPQVSVGMLDTLLGDAEQQTEMFTSVASTDVVEQSADGFTIRQVHVSSRISPREGLVVFKRTESEGIVTHRYALADVQPPASSGHVTIAEHQGFWTFSAGSAGGIQLTYQATYLPGGNIPALLVRRFQTPAIIRTVEEVYRTLQQ